MWVVQVQQAEPELSKQIYGCVVVTVVAVRNYMRTIMKAGAVSAHHLMLLQLLTV